jgi:hypothetical protein
MTAKTQRPFSVKFTRNPAFTPASLTDHQLARIENLALAYMKRIKSGCFSKDMAQELALTWIMDHRRTQPARPGDPWSPLVQSATAQAVRGQLASDDAFDYFVNCLKWVIACGTRGHWLNENRPVRDRRAWAQMRGSY